MSHIVSQLIHKGLKEILHIKKYEGEVCSDILKEELQKDKPSMIARFGSTEIKAIIYPKTPALIRSLTKHRVLSNMEILSGFFPSTEDSIRRFSKLMIEDMKQLDVLGSWRIEERFLLHNFPSAKRIQLNALEPYLQKNPWTEVLKDKKVLVVHPFNQTIEQQYFNKRELLFNDPRVLPAFQTFETIKAVQTIAGNKGTFNNWFEALDYMKEEISQRDFDIAIIGCGAYGFPLAAHVKRIGKKAVHLGGATQLLFGIKGKRWIDREDFKSIINEHFVTPSEQDKPRNSNQVEGGCYW